jgi:signal transduction histidine kinase
VLTPSGAVVVSQPASLTALPHAHRWQTAHVHGLDGEWRFIALPATVDGQQRILVVGRSLHAREETLHRLGREYLIAAPVALLLAVLAGYGLAAAALRPVEAMRRRAAAVSADEPGQRLPVPDANDEIRALAVTLNDMLARLEASFEHERRFLSDASHELRTPLALLRGELELALSRPRSRAELEAAVRSAAEETERLSRLAEDLLLIARADQGKLPLRAERVGVPDLLERVRTRFATHAADLGRDVGVETDGDASVVADTLRVEQALGNLVSNAFEHGDGTVTLRSRTVDGRVELHVTDEGAGFPEGFVTRAFDRFSRADDARGSGGAGLGLAIVDLIARAHGGDAHVVNRRDGGSDAWISLRRAS